MSDPKATTPAPGPDEPQAAGGVNFAVDAAEMKRVYGLLDRSRASRHLARVTEEVLTTGKSDSALEVAVAVLTRPDRHNYRSRQLAAWVLGRAALSGERRTFAIETLLHALHRRLEPEPGRSHAKVLVIVLGALFLAGVVGDAGPGAAGPLLMIALAVAAVTLTASAGSSNRASRRVMSEAIGSLAELRAVEALPAVVDIAASAKPRASERRSVQSAAWSALPSLLRAVGPDQYGRLPDQTFGQLERLLGSGDDDLVLATLAAFENAAGKQTLGAVRKIAAGRGRAGRNAAVRTAAVRCQAAIEARLAAEADQRTLVRAAAEAADVELLRPADTTLSGVDGQDDLVIPAGSSRDADSGLILRLLEDLARKRDARALPFVREILESGHADEPVRIAALQCSIALGAEQPQCEQAVLGWPASLGENK